MPKILFKEKKRQDFTKQGPEITPIVNVLVGVGFVVLSGFLFFNSFRSFQIAREKLEILDRAQREVTDLRLRNIALILEKDKIETDDYTETDIRNRLNYSKKGEIIFVISEDILSLSMAEVDRILKPSVVQQESKSTWEQWKELFVYGI